jgi:hypothetical protein
MGDIGVDGNIILKYILKKYRMRVWSEFYWLNAGNTGGMLRTL